MRSPSAAWLIGVAGEAGAGARDDPRAFTPAAFWAGASEAAPSNAAINVRARKNERRRTAIPRWPRHAGAQHACPCEDHPQAINDSGSWRFQGTKLWTAAAGLKRSLRIDAAGSLNLPVVCRILGFFESYMKRRMPVVRAPVTASPRRFRRARPPGR